jgi:hypothetical protein
MRRPDSSWKKLEGLLWCHKYIDGRYVEKWGFGLLREEFRVP